MKLFELFCVIQSFKDKLNAWNLYVCYYIGVALSSIRHDPPVDLFAEL